jgi:hypothetical protein
VQQNNTDKEKLLQLIQTMLRESTGFSPQTASNLTTLLKERLPNNLRTTEEQENIRQLCSLILCLGYAVPANNVVTQVEQFINSLHASPPQKKK